MTEHGHGIPIVSHDDDDDDCVTCVHCKAPAWWDEDLRRFWCACPEDTA